MSIETDFPVGCRVSYQWRPGAYWRGVVTGYKGNEVIFRDKAGFYVVAAKKLRRIDKPKETDTCPVT